MTENSQSEENLTEELQKLGRNLISALRAAWETPGRKRLEEDIASGLNDLGNTLKNEIDYLAQSQTGQQIRQGIEQIGERIRSAEAQERIRLELLSTLKTVNTELQKVAERWKVEEQDSQARPEENPPSESTATEDDIRGEPETENE